MSFGSLLRTKIYPTSLRMKSRPRCVPESCGVYAIGDIHGRADLLERLHEQIRADVAEELDNTRNLVIYLGDYIDRGPDSKAEIYVLLRKPLRGFEAVYLKGNHEDALLWFLDDSSVGPLWFAIGGGATVKSYGVRVPVERSSEKLFENVRRGLLSRLPGDHRKFLSALSLRYEIGDYAFVHVGVRPGRPLHQQMPEDIMWIRKEFLSSSADFGQIIVHGHSPREKPEVCANRIGIDTAAYATDILTSLVLWGQERRFLFASTAQIDRDSLEWNSNQEPLV